MKLGIVKIKAFGLDDQTTFRSKNNDKYYHPLLLLYIVKD